MQRWGKTVAKTVRFRCPSCHKSSIRKRSDVTKTSRYQLFLLWLTGTKSLTEIAQGRHISRQSLAVWFRPFRKTCPVPLVPEENAAVLVIDGLYLESRYHCVLIGKTPRAVVSWLFAERETYGSWRLFCQRVPAPRVVVCDGQRGMRSAIRYMWPQTRIQRCIVHVFQLATARLTQRPKTTAGQSLRI